MPPYFSSISHTLENTMYISYIDGMARLRGNHESKANKSGVDLAAFSGAGSHSLDTTGKAGLSIITCALLRIQS